MTATDSEVVDAAQHDPVMVVDRLRELFRTGATRSDQWRLAQLIGLERFLAEQEPAIAQALLADLGKEPIDSALSEIGPVRSESAFARRHLRRWTRPSRVGVPLIQRPAQASFAPEPRGVVLIIGAWNYPVHLTLAPLVGALAAGNTVVVKPSEHAPATSALLARLLPRYLDPKAVAVVEGGATQTQQLLAARPDFAFFTGSAAVGRSVMHAAAANLTPVALELGGKSPVVVSDDADIDVVGRRIAFGKVVNAGQTCVAPDYVLVSPSSADQLVEAIRSSLQRFTSDKPEAGLRVLNEHHARRLAALIEGGGGSVILGGGVDAEQARVQPTIIVDPDLGSPLMAEEIFGPVLPIIRVDSFDGALDFIARRPHPLAAYLFSKDAATQRRFQRDVQAGGVVINHLMMQVAVPQLPFGGVGPSGMGAYHGKWGFDTFSHRKAILVKPFRPDVKLLYPPYGRLRQQILRRFM